MRSSNSQLHTTWVRVYEVCIEKLFDIEGSYTALPYTLFVVRNYLGYRYCNYFLGYRYCNYFVHGLCPSQFCMCGMHTANWYMGSITPESFHISCSDFAGVSGEQTCHTSSGPHTTLLAIGKPRVSPLLSLNTSAVIQYLICGLRVTFLRRKTVTLQSNIAHRE
jgi:hypothetical protein